MYRKKNKNKLIGFRYSVTGWGTGFSSSIAGLAVRKKPYKSHNVRIE